MLGLTICLAISPAATARRTKPEPTTQTATQDQQRTVSETGRGGRARCRFPTASRSRSSPPSRTSPNRSPFVLTIAAGCGWSRTSTIDTRRNHTDDQVSRIQILEDTDRRRRLRQEEDVYRQADFHLGHRLGFRRRLCRIATESDFHSRRRWRRHSRTDRRKCC